MCKQGGHYRTRVQEAALTEAFDRAGADTTRRLGLRQFTSLLRLVVFAHTWRGALDVVEDRCTGGAGTQRIVGAPNFQLACEILGIPITSSEAAITFGKLDLHLKGTLCSRIDARICFVCCSQSCMGCMGCSSQRGG